MPLIALHYQEARDLIIIDTASFDDFSQKRADNFVLLSRAGNPPSQLAQLSPHADVIETQIHLSKKFTALSVCAWSACRAGSPYRFSASCARAGTGSKGRKPRWDCTAPPFTALTGTPVESRVRATTPQTLPVMPDAAGIAKSGSHRAVGGEQANRRSHSAYKEAR